MNLAPNNLRDQSERFAKHDHNLALEPLSLSADDYGKGFKASSKG